MLKYFLFFTLSWATQKMCIVFNFSSTSIHAVCVNVPLRPGGQKWTPSVLPWRSRFPWRQAVQRIPLRDREQAHRVVFLVSCLDAKEVAGHRSPRNCLNCLFSIQNCFRGNFAICSHSAELELLGPGLWVLVPSKSVFFPHKAAATQNCSAQTNWVQLAKEKQRN